MITDPSCGLRWLVISVISVSLENIQLLEGPCWMKELSSGYLNWLYQNKDLLNKNVDKKQLHTKSTKYKVSARHFSLNLFVFFSHKELIMKGLKLYLPSRFLHLCGSYRP